MAQTQEHILMPEEEKEFMLILAHLFLSYGKFNKAKPILTSLNKMFPKDYHVIRSIAYLNLEAGNLEEALQNAEHAMHPTMSPKERSFSLLIKSKALWRLGRTHEAKQAIQQYLQSKKAAS